MRITLLIFWFFIIQSSVFPIDSLLINKKLNQLERADPEQKLILLEELSWVLIKEDKERAEKLAEEGINLALEMNDSIGFYNLCSNLGAIKRRKGDYSESIELLGKSTAFFRRSGNPGKEATNLNRLGIAYSYKGNYPKSDSLLCQADEMFIELKNDTSRLEVLVNKSINFIFWKKFDQAKTVCIEGLALIEKTGEDKLIFSFYNNLGITEYEIGNFLKAIEYYLKAVDNDKVQKLHKSNTYNNIGNVYNQLNEWDSALKYHQMALKGREAFGSERLRASSLINIGVVYKNKANYGIALDYYMKALKILKSLEGKNNRIEHVLNNIGIVHMHLQSYEEAEHFLMQSLEESEKRNNNFNKCRVLANLGNVYLNSGRYDKSVQYGHLGLELAEKINYPLIIQQVANTLSEAYELKGNYKEAGLYKAKFWEVKDSIFNKETLGRIAELGDKYKKVQTENQLLLQKKEIQELEERRKYDRIKLLILILSCFLLGAITFLFIILRNNEIKKLSEFEKLSTLKFQNEKLEKELLTEKLSKQKDELNNYLDLLTEKTELLSKIKKEIEDYPNNKTELSTISNLTNFLDENLQTEKDWNN